MYIFNTPRWAIPTVFSILVAITTNLPSAVASGASLQVPQVLASYIDVKSHPMTIDGSTVDWTVELMDHSVEFYKGDGKTGSLTRIGTTLCGTMDDRKDGEVKFCLAHDGEYLYMLTIIRDDLLEQRTSENNTNEAWKEDGLHIYIDSTNARRKGIPDPPLRHQIGYEQFGVSTDYNCYTEGCDFVTHLEENGSAAAGAQPDQTNWLVKTRISGTGPFTYVFEQRIPLHEVSGHNLKTMRPGETYGINVEFVDSDAGKFLEGYIFWASDGKTDAYTDQSLWGKMTLEPVKKIPVHVGIQGKVLCPRTNGKG